MSAPEWRSTPPDNPVEGEVWYHDRYGALRYTSFDLRKEHGWEKDATVYGWSYITGRANTVGGLSGNLAVETHADGKPFCRERDKLAEYGWYGPIPPRPKD